MWNFLEGRAMTSDFTDLYKHGAKMNTVAKRFFSEFKKYEQEGNDDLMRIYAEAFRKITMNIVEVACKVLAVEDLLKGKKTYT